ncbi:late embryogenesis abundant protein [Mucilaginibacter gracilis]|uniref:Late embryogenesis abundant protein n=1 Tax=Mucilaginibacter gracilis TaxID=423350 RepID=A0A495IXB1_9SPHI|nr:LEA type 2 family protein [Mucilaginibacter gracilis]RKR81315.1 late embryogenesis abundant protein [Mucilaginibacter gracilis]
MTKALGNTLKGTILITALVILAGCSKPKDLTYGAITDVSVKNLSLSGVDVEATIPVDNPNSYAITVQEANLDLMLDDKVIAHVLQSYPVTVAAKTKGDYKVGASIKLANAGAIMSLMSLMNNNTDRNLSLDGTLKAKSFVITKTVQVHQTNIQNYLKPVIDKLKLF